MIGQIWKLANDGAGRNLLGAAEAEMLRRGAEAGRDGPDVEASMDQPVFLLVERQNELKPSTQSQRWSQAIVFWADDDTKLQ